MVASLVALAIIGYILYLLFVKGLIFEIILCLFGILGGTIALLTFFPSSKQTAVIIGSMNFNYAVVISVLLVVTGLAVVSEGGHNK